MRLCVTYTLCHVCTFGGHHSPDTERNHTAPVTALFKVSDLTGNGRVEDTMVGGDNSGMCQAGGVRRGFAQKEV